MYFREAFSYKFHLTTLHLEQLWSLAHLSDKPLTLREILTNIYDSHHFDEDKYLLPSFAIEGFILQETAFLDFYMLYLCSIFRINETNYLSGRKFLKALDGVNEEPYQDRAQDVRVYFAEKVFGNSDNGSLITANWGNLLKDLRNSLVHRDMLYPNFQDGISLLEQIIGEWPKREWDLGYSRFCQDVQNVMFYQITKLAAIVYGLEYKPGPYKPGMW